MDRLKALEIFTSVAQRKSFAGAAAALELANSVVTRAVQDLEASLGVPLLRRTTRRVTLTAEGEDVLARAQTLLRGYDELLATSSISAAEPAGGIKLSVPVFYGTRHLAPALATFMAKYPKVSLDVQLTDAHQDLVQEGVDLTVRITRDLQESLIARQIGEVPVGLHASPAYLVRKGRPEDPSELIHHQCLTYDGSGRMAHWSLSHQASGARVDVPARGVFNSNNGEVLAAMAARGAGIALLPKFMAQEALARGELVRVLDEWQTRPLGVYLAYSSRRNQPLRVRLLIDHLLQALAGAQDEPSRSSGADTSRQGVASPELVDAAESS